MNDPDQIATAINSLRVPLYLIAAILYFNCMIMCGK